MDRIRLGLLAASPMYYQAPLYRRFAADDRIDFTAIFASRDGTQPHDAGFGQLIEWDMDALQGYRYHFLRRSETNHIGGNFFSFHDTDIIGLVRKERFDVLWLHGYNSLTHQLGALTQILGGRPLLVREEQTLLHPRGPLKQMAKGIGLRWLLRRSRGLYIGTQNRRWFERYGVPDERLFFTPYCVDNEHFQIAAEELKPLRPTIREQFSIPADSGPIITMVARLIPKKQPQFLLEAFRRVRSKQPCSLLLVGSGELENELRTRVKEQGIPDVIFAGFLNQSQISRAYACSDIFVLPSAYDETWGLVVNEAMNFGLPVVVSDKVGSGVDLVRQGENGFIVPSNDPQPLAERLEELVKNGSMRAEFGARSREIVEEFNYDVTARGVVAAVAASVGAERWSRATATRSSA